LACAENGDIDKPKIQIIIAMDNFLKQFRDNLESRPEPAFAENDWLALSQKLQPRKEKRPLSMILLWSLLPLFLVSLGANGFLYRQMHNAERKLALLNSRTDTVFQKSIVLETDTIYKYRTIFERDTIYRTQILKETAIAHTPTFFENNPNSTDSDNANTSSNTIAKTRFNANDLKLDSTVLKNNNTDNVLVLNDLEKIKTLKPSFLKLNKKWDEPEVGTFPIIQNPPKTLRQKLEAMRPKSYSLGASAGLVYPYGNGLSQPSGFALGGNGEMYFSPNVSAWASVHYLKSVYNVDKMGDAIGVPIMPPPNNLLSFNLATIKQPTIQYLVGFGYHFNSKKEWKPYLGLGFGAATLLPYEVGYEFKNSTLGTVWDIDQTVKKRGTQWGFMQLDAGIEKRFSQQYRWQLGAQYRINLKTNDLQKHKVFGVKTGILFDF
jgi:hypothetical protein